MTQPHPLACRPMRTLTLLLLLATCAAAAAQANGAPRVGLAPFTTTVGGEVRLDADRLTPGERYRLEVRSPSGDTVERTLDADASGALGTTIVLTEAGTYEVTLAGPGVEASLRARADAPPTPPAPAPPAAPAPAPDAPAPDAPVPDDDAEPADVPGTEPDAEPDAATSDDAPAPASGPTTLTLADGGAELRDGDGALVWRFSRPDDSGDTRAVLLHVGRAWIAHGHTVFEVDLADGHVVSRATTSGPIVALEPLGSGVRAVAEVAVGRGTTRVEHRVENGFASPPATFAPDSPVLRWWQAEADVPDPSGALRRDPTNPHLYVRVATLSDDDAEREAALRDAIAAGGPFFERAQVARQAAALGFLELADDAMRAAVADFEMRGYDPALLVDPVAHDRFGFPLRPLLRAVQTDDLEAAALWADWLPRTAGVGMRGAADALREYADRQRAAGDAEGAAATRERASAMGATSARRVVNAAAVDLGRGGWYAAVALVVSALALHLTLIGKYWRVQELLIRRARETGRRASAAWHLRAIRHYGTTEKLSLVILLAAAHAAGALAVWSERGDPAVAAAASGHLEAPFVAPLLQPFATADGGQGQLLLAYRSYRAGDVDGARTVLERAVLDGVAEADVALEALTDEGRAWAPSSATIRESVTGSWARAVADAYRDPFGYLAAAPAAERLPAWVSPFALGLFLAVLALHVLSLLLPRPRIARNAPRTPLYHVLALLVPGSGATDELWGVLLLVPWAVFGIDAVAQLVWSSSPLDVPLLTGAWILGALYVVNLVAWAVELASYRRRMRDLRRDQSDLAAEYGMKPLPAGR